MNLTSHLLPDRQIEALKDLKVQTGITSSEWLRRMIDYCLQDQILNQLAPALSGHISVSK
jgi:hypothetical protein